MKSILNYNKGENLATGFARLKVTSLFLIKYGFPNSYYVTLINPNIMLSQKQY